MTSAFYKYILTTMVRTPCSPHPLLPQAGPPQPHAHFSAPGLPHPALGRGRGGLLQHPGLLQVQHPAALRSRVCAQPQSVLEGELRSQHLPRPCGKLMPYPQLADTSEVPSGLGRSCSEPVVSLLLSEYIQEVSQCGLD